jgi:hypothetical protein
LVARCARDRSGLRVEVLETRDLGEFVIGTVRVRGHGLDSDTPFEETVWGAGKWRRGRVLWWQTFESEGEAAKPLKAEVAMAGVGPSVPAWVSRV